MERNTQHPTPSSRDIPESKHQEPSSKHQRNPKFQAPNRGPRFELGSWSLELGTWSFFGHRSLELGASHPVPVASTERLNKNQIGFVLAQSQVVAAHFDFHRVAERRESDQFNGSSHQHSHFEEATSVFGRHFDFGDGGGRADRQGSQRLTGNGHNQATVSSARSGSTQMASANSALMPRRALQTWQMTLLCWLSSLMRCSSQNPISRRR